MVAKRFFFSSLFYPEDVKKCVKDVMLFFAMIYEYEIFCVFIQSTTNKYKIDLFPRIYLVVKYFLYIYMSVGILYLFDVISIFDNGFSMFASPVETMKYYVNILHICVNL